MTKSQIYWPYTGTGSGNWENLSFSEAKRGRISLPGKAKRAIYMPKPSDDQIQMISFKQTDVLSTNGLTSNGLHSNAVKNENADEEVIDIYNNTVRS